MTPTTLAGRGLPVVCLLSPSLCPGAVLAGAFFARVIVGFHVVQSIFFGSKGTGK